MTTMTGELTQRERELAAIIDSYNVVTEQLKSAHEQLRDEVARLREEVAKKNRLLRRREKLAALGEMAAGVAHEIRNPLGGIRLLVSLLAKDLYDRPETLNLVNKIAGGVADLEALVTDILEFGRPSEPHPMPLELDIVALATIEMASGRIARNGAEVEVTKELEGVVIHSDQALLQRALLNLVLNALEAGEPRAEPPRRVVIGLRSAPKDHVILSVWDNGPGIPTELMDRIFNPFFTTKNRGTGLGLAIVHQIAETLGGSVWAANHGEGGAVFSLCLPRCLEVAQVTDDHGDIGRTRVGARSRAREHKEVA